MKKRMILAASLMAAVALTSCNNNDFVEDDVQTGSAQLVEIKVGQAVQGIETKAAINKGDQVKATIIATKGAITDGTEAAFWAAFIPVLDNSYQPSDEWNATTFANVATGSFEAGTNVAIGLVPALFASPASSTAGGATLTGVAPAGTVNSGKVKFSVFDGQQDVMTAKTTAHNVVSGGGTTIDPFALTFEHRTAQLRFDFSATNTAGTGAWSKPTDVLKVKSVTVKAAQVPNAVVLGKTMDLEWTKEQNLALDNLTKNTIPTTFGSTEPTKRDSVLIDKVAMVKPGVEVVLDVVLTINGVDKLYSDVKPGKVGGGKLTTAEGKYHIINLTIKEPTKPTGTPTITATATVTEWKVGDEGEAELK